jgi:hypothetical protein
MYKQLSLNFLALGLITGLVLVTEIYLFNHGNPAAHSINQTVANPERRIFLTKANTSLGISFQQPLQVFLMVIIILF